MQYQKITKKLQKMRKGIAILSEV